MLEKQKMVFHAHLNDWKLKDPPFPENIMQSINQSKDRPPQPQPDKPQSIQQLRFPAHRRRREKPRDGANHQEQRRCQGPPGAAASIGGGGGVGEAADERAERSAEEGGGELGEGG